MFISAHINKSIFKDVRFVIVDEVHNFAENDRGIHLLALIEKIQLVSNYQIQRIGMSATIANPKEVLHWFVGASTLPSMVVQPTIIKKNRAWKVVYQEEFQPAISGIEKIVLNKKSIVFVKSKGLAEKISRTFIHLEPLVHHASVDKDLREYIEEQMVDTKRCVISTSTLELGIDIGDLDLIVQYGLPPSVSSLLQRIGRTGRRPDQVPRAHCFCENQIDLLLTLAMINCAEKGNLSPIRSKSNNYHLFFHQILCSILQKYGLTKQELFKIKARNNSFSGITDSEVDELLNFWLHHDYLRFDGRLFLIGAAADARLSFRNYADLYAVFSARDEYEVYHYRTRIGSLDPSFVMNLAVPFNFTLAGKDWTAVDVDHDYKTVLAESTILSKEPRWGSKVGQVISREVAEECRFILEDGLLEASIDLDHSGQKELENLRETIPLKSWTKPNHAYLITFTGTKINHTLALSIKALLNIEVEEDFYMLDLYSKKTPGDEIFKKVQELFETLSLLTCEELESFLSPLVEEYDYSKFTPFLPETFNKKFIIEEVFDLEGTLDWLKGTEKNLKLALENSSSNNQVQTNDTT